MSDIEFIGMIQAQKVSEIHPARGPAIDRDYVRAFAQAHEQAGFDRVLVPHHSTSPDATLTVAYAATGTPPPARPAPPPARPRPGTRRGRTRTRTSHTPDTAHRQAACPPPHHTPPAPTN